MKKIATALGVLDTPWHVLSFATKIAKENSGSILGIFVDDSSESSAGHYPFPNDLSLTKEELSDKGISIESDQLIGDNIKMFKNECDETGVKYEILKSDSVGDAIKKAEDADMIVCDTKAGFLEKLLEDAVSPVCLVSENELPQKVILLYDGNASSKHAIKKYSDLFPKWNSLPTVLVSINPSEKEKASIDDYVSSLRNNLKNVTIQLLDGDVKKELIRFLGTDPEHILVVMGAFGRSEISMFFKESLANVVLEETRLSLFIAHTQK